MKVFKYETALITQKMFNCFKNIHTFLYKDIYVNS